MKVVTEPSSTELRTLALDARENAYAPYRGFRVGAAVEGLDGQRSAGCNVENHSFPQSICAERNAISTAVTAGARSLKSVYVVAETLSPPCGGCLSVIAQFASPELEIIAADLAGHERRWSLSDLLPEPFERFRDG